MTKKDITGRVEEQLWLDIFTVTVLDSKNNVICMDALTQADLGIEVSSNEIRGGQGNRLIATVGADKKFNITTSEPVFRLDSLALSMGSEIKTYSGNVYCPAKMYDVKSNTTITLENEPISKESIIIYGEDGNKVPTEKITWESGKNVTLASFTGTKAMVVYQYSAPEGTSSIEISSKNFPKECKMILEAPIISTGEEITSYIQLVIPRVKPDGNWSLSMGANREAVASEIKWNVLSNSNGRLGEFIQIPAGAASLNLLKEDLVL